MPPIPTDSQATTIMANPQSTDGTLALELRRAGVLTHPDRLQKLAQEAWRDHSGERDEGKRRKVVSDRLRDSLLWALIEKWKPAILGQAVGWLLETNMPKTQREAMEARQAAALQIPPSNVTRLQDNLRRTSAVLDKAYVKVSKLDTVLIYGKPIGDCLVMEVTAWADQREKEMREAGRDVRFARSLIANLTSGERIRDWWGGARETEVDGIYATAELG